MRRRGLAVAVGRGVLQILGVVLVASVMIFIAVHVLPGSPAQQILGRNASASAVAAKARQLGLDRSLVAQYLSWIGGMLHAQFGNSLTSQQSVLSILGSTVPVTLLLVALAMIVAAVLGIALGVVAVRRPGGLVDRGVTAYAALLSALPAFVWGLCLVLVVSLTLRWLPSFGYVSPFTHPRQGVESLVMPVLALSLPPMGVITRIVRVTLNESLQGDYIAFARSKGLSARRLVLVHALRGAAVPISAIIGTEFAYTLGDAVAVESVFGIPGVGNLLLNSFLQRDYPTIQGAVIVLTLVVVLVTTLSDLSAAKFDPRIRDAAMSPRTA